MWRLNMPLELEAKSWPDEAPLTFLFTFEAGLEFDGLSSLISSLL